MELNKMTQDKFYEVNSSQDRTRYFSSLVKAHKFCRDSLTKLPISNVQMASLEWKDFDFPRNSFTHYTPLGCYSIDISDPKDFDTFGLMVSYHITERKMD
tara:strand:+ start:159 stop:458 length:300 start_codon:yes stop_codon:yes gene_type:complete